MHDTGSQTGQPARPQQTRYEALSPVGQAQVHIRFPGRFEGRDVIWDARLHTLRYEYEQACTGSGPVPDEFRQYIHIQPAVGDQVPITIALNVPQFDEPAILKTLIMIHNYKRLRLGRHEFGQPISFSDCQTSE